MHIQRFNPSVFPHERNWFVVLGRDIYIKKENTPSPRDGNIS
jgi:hypothetical protein